VNVLDGKAISLPCFLLNKGARAHKDGKEVRNNHLLALSN
jgi:hypothetical protein